MKNICFESYRQSKRDKMQQWKTKPKQLAPNWYTENIFSNHSEDVDEDNFTHECLKYSMPSTCRKLLNIRERDELFVDTGVTDDYVTTTDFREESRERRGEGEGSAGYGLTRSISCKEFNHYHPKTQTYLFASDGYDEEIASDTAPPISYIPPALPLSQPPLPPTSILKNRANVPKSYSFSAATTSSSAKTMPFDIMDYEVPPKDGRMGGKARHEWLDTFRKPIGYYCSTSLDENALSTTYDVVHPCCAGEHCTSTKCLLDDTFSDNYDTLIDGARRGPWRRMAPSVSTMSGFYGVGASAGSNRNIPETNWWDERNNQRVARASRYSLLSGGHGQLHSPLPPKVICCCTADPDCCYQRQQHRHLARSRASYYHCPGHHLAAEDDEPLHYRTKTYDTDINHFTRDEHERLLFQDKFLDDDEYYLNATRLPRRHYTIYKHPTRSKSMQDVHPPNRYDEDSCSNSTEMDLRDFNIDLEKYWEELEKPPSPIDIDMQRRNMQSNLKVKNVNVGCYNNGQPIHLHDREQERMMIKKSLLEGMPSPPQVEHPTNSPTADLNLNNKANRFNFFEQTDSPLHRSAFTYGHKVYPTAETLPSYQYNNFYSTQNFATQTQQPTSSGHHTSASSHSALSLINNIFSIYKPNKYAPQNCRLNNETKPEPCKKMNVPSTRRPLGAPHSEYMHSMKRPLIVSTEQPHFKIVPEKTGLKIAPFNSCDDDNLLQNEYDIKPELTRLKLTSTARPLMLPH